MRDVAIIGVGMTSFGEHWSKGFRELVVEAGTNALKDAGISGEKVDAGFVGTMASGKLIGQEHIGALIADFMGLNPIPITRVEGACASGSLALRQGIMAVSSGMHDTVVVGGVEKMTDLGTTGVTTALGGAGDQEWELFFGATFPALYALMARRHMIDFGTTEEMLASVSVKNHKHGSMNPNAQFQNQITLQDVLNSKMVANPLKILDCSPISDGAAALVLVPLEKAHSYTKKPVRILASAQASDTISLHSRESLTGVKSAQIASQNAYKYAKLSPKNIDVAEVHDCFSIAEIMAIEDLGFFKKGEGGIASLEGRTSLGGEIPINTSGGLKACGHPVGATGVKQLVELYWQLKGDAGNRQVKDANIGLSHNVGGSGATTVVHIVKGEW
ncbi:MAG: thiolase domain-containing protein [Candidatus ainarchaeum sp.]|nr:thiolase domain-containing protein [Candidatus ainarchaeum sp.]